MRVARALSRLHEEQSGIAAVFMAITVVVLIGFAALTVDGGTLFMQRRRMVTASDSAALAAAQSFADGESTCGSSEGPAQGWADNTSAQNVPTRQHASGATLTHYTNPVPTDWWATDCVNQTVTTIYQTTATQVFSGIFGAGNRPVSARAIAHWGPAGAFAGLAPFMLSEGRLSTCQIPPPEGPPPVGLECKFYWNNNNTYIGQSSWGPMDLGDGWNVAPDAHCNGVGASDIVGWINGSAPALALNWPAPTFVCAVAGAKTSDFSELADHIGEQMTFPVNDPCQVNGPEHGQVDTGGGQVGPPPCAVGTPDKWDIVGFVTLQLTTLIRGNDKDFETTCPEFIVPPTYPVKPDSNSYCMIATWVDFSHGGFDPGGGSDLGTSAVGLIG